MREEKTNIGLRATPGFKRFGSRSQIPNFRFQIQRFNLEFEIRLRLFSRAATEEARGRLKTSVYSRRGRGDAGAPACWAGP
jgi:hypothetical protein